MASILLKPIPGAAVNDRPVPEEYTRNGMADPVVSVSGCETPGLL